VGGFSLEEECGVAGLVASYLGVNVIQAYEFIDGYQNVLSAFGRWPSFHDAEVHKVILDRKRLVANGASYSSVELLVHGWNMTTDITEQGHYKHEASNLVHFLFDYVTDLELSGLNHQNVLDGLELTLQMDEHTGKTSISVELCHCWGLSGGFKARQAKVLSVTPYSYP
jgi:Immunity protein 50